MAKKRDIAHSLSLCAQRIIPLIVRGVFEWNGELFACPFITLEDKKRPTALTTWKHEFNEKRNSPVFRDPQLPLLLFFADPINPRTFKKLRMYTMDRNFGVDENTRVHLKGNDTVIIKNGNKVDMIRFVHPLTDAERLKIFPMDSYGNMLRYRIYELSKPGAPTQIGIFNLEAVLDRWEQLQAKAA